MIEFRYNPKSINEEQAEDLAAFFEEALREIIIAVRKDAPSGFGITTEGDPFRIRRNQPLLRIYVFYHQQWKFTPEELETLANKMSQEVRSFLDTEGMKRISGVVRFYERTGHASSQIPVTK